MNETTLEPYTVQLSFKGPEAKDLREWGLIIGAFMEALAQNCSADGPALIGHIKGFAQLPDQGFMKVSVIDTKHRAEITGDMRGRAPELDMTLNVLVYGHTRNKLEELIFETIATPGKLWSDRVLKA